MSTVTAKASTATSKTRRRVVGQAKRGLVKVTLGDVTVYVTKPSKEQVRQNVLSGVEALQRVAASRKRGIRLYPKKNVPLYSADPEQPGVYIRKMNGKVDRGVLKDGAFQVQG